ncbi:hypothetical protein EB796_023063 [Bugula neritina]|uniref:Tetraspanin n=1 Tax=Bugula neritina TaxID=10212 RepID=A0A7J7IZH3_BUGNE|nr:hypothetical protein EB796_023063 [Bugula neritina]
MQNLLMGFKMKMQRMSCCDTTSKILLIIFNCIFWAFGVAILIVGIWIKTDPEISNLGQAVKVGDAEPVVEIVTWLFIGAGIFVFAVGVVGMIGIIRESKIMMGFYIVCVFIVFAAEASAGVYAGVRKDYIIEKIKDEGAKFIKNSYTDDANSDYYLISKGFNYVQVQFKCCGVNDFLDYQGSVYIEELGNRIKPNASMSWACCTPDTELDDAFKNNGQLTVSADNRGQYSSKHAVY